MRETRSNDKPVDVATDGAGFEVDVERFHRPDAYRLVNAPRFWKAAVARRRIKALEPGRTDPA